MKRWPQRHIKARDSSVRTFLNQTHRRVTLWGAVGYFKARAVITGPHKTSSKAAEGERRSEAPETAAGCSPASGAAAVVDCCLMLFLRR